MARAPVYLPSAARGAAGPPPSREATLKGTAAVALLLMTSASLRLHLRRSRVRELERLHGVVVAHRDAFVQVRLEPGTLARWDEAGRVYRAATGARASLTAADDGDDVFELAPGTPIDVGPHLARPADDSGAELLAPHRHPVWLLGRVSRGDADGQTFRRGERPRFEPVIDRFVIVAELGSDPPPTRRATLVRWLAYPLAAALSLVSLIAWLDDGSPWLAWIFGLVVVFGFVELFAWIFFAHER